MSLDEVIRQAQSQRDRLAIQLATLQQLQAAAQHDVRAAEVQAANAEQMLANDESSMCAGVWQQRRSAFERQRQEVVNMREQADHLDRDCVLALETLMRVEQRLQGFRTLQARRQLQADQVAESVAQSQWDDVLRTRASLSLQDREG